MLDVTRPLTERTLHLCIDMQRLFSAEGPWPTPWMDRVLPVAAALVEQAPERTVFTRFIPPRRADDMPGTWRRYYRKWEAATRERLDPGLLDLMPRLATHVPPGTVVDKPFYSGFSTATLPRLLRQRQADGLIVTGAETDMCVLATVLGAIDHGYRVIVVMDAVCSSSDAGHDHLLDLYDRRFGEQVETADSETVRMLWPLGGAERRGYRSASGRKSG